MTRGSAASKLAPAENGPPGTPDCKELVCQITTPAYWFSAKSIACWIPFKTSALKVFIFERNDTTNTSGCPLSTQARKSVFSKIV